MENIKIITIQGKEVLDKLQNDGIYYSNAEEYIKNHKSNLLKPYQYLMSEYKYNHFPIFACAVGHHCEYYGANDRENAILMKLSVPEDAIKIQYYYDWTDLILFTEFPDDEGFSCPFEEFRHGVLFSTNIHNCVPPKPVQVTLQELRKEWLIDSTPLTEKFTSLHYGSGGSNVLQELDYYKI